MQETGELLKGKAKMSVLVGSETDIRDAQRNRKDVGINALQIVTGGMCHTKAQNDSPSVRVCRFRGY